MYLSPLTLAAASIVAVLVALTITGLRRHHHEQLLARLRATTDPSTGTLNRRGFVPRFTELVETNADLGRVVSVVMFDLDRYLDFRERNGRDAADKGVRRVANILARLSRDVDLVAQLGDDEFIVALPGAEAADALSFAERVAWALGSEQLDPALRFTTSSGIASAAPGDPEVDTLVARAEQAVQEAKRAGGTRTAWWDGAMVHVGDPADVPEPLGDARVPLRPRELIVRRNDVADRPRRASA